LPRGGEGGGVALLFILMTELKKIFNISVSTIKNLDGDVNYSNIKYALEATNGTKYILKIFPDKDELILAKEESKILNEIGKGLSFKVPQTIPASVNSLFFQHEKGEAKLLHYIEGDFIATVPHTKELLSSLGEKIAELHKALQKVESPIMASRKLFWDLQHAPMSYHKINLIAEPERRKLIAYYLDRFQYFVLPVQHTLRHSLIHGDLNDYNILVKDGKVEGFLDFGDCTYSPMVNDLAIAMTYLMLEKENLFEDILPLLQGYSSVSKLSHEEVELLPDLITTRLCISLCNSAEKKHLGQDNEYVLVSEEPAWTLIEKWIAVNPIKIKNIFLQATGFEIENAENKTEEILKLRKRVAGKSLGLSYSSPIHITAAAFQYMFGGHGDTYLDAYNNIPHIGHSHPRVSEAITKQIRILNTNSRYLQELFVDYSSILLQHFPSKLSKVFLVNSGSEAADLAIRMARTCTKRNSVAVLEHGYHGNTSLGIEISSYKFDGKGGKGISPNSIKLPLPNLYKGKYSSGREYAADAIAIIQRAIENNNKPCAFIAEPISGCGGQVPLAPQYLKELKAFLDANDILTITDEVQTGFGRLGNWFWGFEMHDVIPDIVILGKPMGNGHPIAAVVTTEAIADGFANGMEFFSSFGGNAVSCAAAKAVLEIIKEEKLQENAMCVGSYFKEKLKELQLRHNAIGDIRGEGLFLGIEFMDVEGKPDSIKASHIKNELKNQFILTGTDGPYDNVIKIKPPLCFDRGNVDWFVGKLEAILKEISKG
jgi:ethanolamine-phosphate phospho-lyase